MSFPNNNNNYQYPPQSSTGYYQQQVITPNNNNIYQHHQQQQSTMHSSAHPYGLPQQQQPQQYPQQHGMMMNNNNNYGMMNNQPNYGQPPQPTYGNPVQHQQQGIVSQPSQPNNAGGSATITTVQQHPHSFYYPYYSYQTTTNVNVPNGGQSVQGSAPPLPYGQPMQPSMQTMQPPSHPYGQPMVNTPPPTVVNNPLTVASVQTSITYTNTSPNYSNSIKFQINPPVHIPPHYSMRGELIMKSQNPFCVRSMNYSPTLIIADSNNSTITLFDSLTGVARESFQVTTGCVGGIGVDPTDDSFYIVSGKNIVKYGANGVHLGTFGQNLNLKSPYGLTVDDQGCVYICDYQQHIVVMSREGAMIRYIPVDKPYDIFFDKLNQTLVVVDQHKDCVRVLTKDGQKIRKIGGKGNAKGQFCSPTGVCVNSGGNIIVADYGNHRVQVFDCTGRFLYSMGNKGRLESEFDLPRSVCTDLHGNLYVTEYGNTRVQVFKKMQ